MKTKKSIMKKACQGKGGAVGRLVGKVEDKAIGALGSALALPAQAYNGYKRMKSDSAANVLKLARSYKGAPDYDSKGNVTDAFKVRTVADSVRRRLTGK
jgi:uncharacterized membrane protein YebE (DUF533 family)